MNRVGVLTGLAGEARLVERAAARLPRPPLVACAGADAGRARREARRLLAERPAGLLSFGLCAGLDPALRPGGLVCAERVVLPDGRALPADPAWRERVLAEAEHRGLRCAAGAVVGSERVLATALDKRALAAKSGAVAADMESHALAEAAAEAGLPLLVLRAVGDAAARRLPRPALHALREDGSTSPAAVLAGLARAPGEAPALVRLAWDVRAGYAALGDVARLAPVLFALA